MKITAYKIGYSDKKDPDRVRYRIKNPLYLYFEMPFGTSRRVGTPEQLKKALTNTEPGSTAFNATPANSGRKSVIHELTDGTFYGKGVPRNSGTFKKSTKVRAGYREVSPGNWQLVTMFPDF